MGAVTRTTRSKFSPGVADVCRSFSYSATLRHISALVKHRLQWTRTHELHLLPAHSYNCVLFPLSSPHDTISSVAMSSYHETENLILEIKKRSIIWDSTSEEYKNKILKNDAWVDVCIAVRHDYNDGSDGLKKQILSELQSRWKSIRDANNRSQKKMKEKSGSGACGSNSKKYMFADLLTFLKKTSTHRETDYDSLEAYSQNESLTTQDTQGDEDQQEMEEPLSPSLSFTPGPASSSTQQNSNTRKRSRKTTLEERMLAFMDRCDDEDADKDFFNSLLPSVRTLTEDQKLEFRSQVITLLQRIKSSRGYSVTPPNPLGQHHHNMMGSPPMMHFNFNYPRTEIPDTSHAQNSTSSLWNRDQQSNSDCHFVLSRPGSSTSSHGNDSCDGN